MILFFIDDDHAAHVYHNIMVDDLGSKDIFTTNYYSVKDAIDGLKCLLEEDDTSGWPDAIILDINMPIKTGWKFLEEYAELPIQSKRTRIFMATNSENPADLLSAKENPLVEGYEIKYLETAFFQKLLVEHYAL